jgi:hypothetical protein
MNVESLSLKAFPMRPILTFSLLCLVCLAVVACRSTRQTEDSHKESGHSDARPAEPGPGVPPNHCRIVGTVVSIEPGRSANPGDPCSKVPCQAIVRVEKVLEYGSSFLPPLSQGSLIRVHFVFTMSPTNNLFPDLKPPLPGLTEGTTFETELSNQGEGGDSVGGAEYRTYQVGPYKVK